MNITPRDFKAGQTVPDNLSWKDLHRYVEKIEGEGFSATPYRVDLNMRIASPFATFLLALLGILVALRPGLHGGIGAGVGISLGVAFAFIAISNVGTSLASAGALPPFLGVWAGNIIFSCDRMLFLGQGVGVTGADRRHGEARPRRAWCLTSDVRLDDNLQSTAQRHLAQQGSGLLPTTRFAKADRVRTGSRPALACAGQDGRSRRRRENPLREFLVQQVETPAFATNQL